MMECGCARVGAWRWWRLCWLDRMATTDDEVEDNDDDDDEDGDEAGDGDEVGDSGSEVADGVGCDVLVVLLRSLGFWAN